MSSQPGQHLHQIKIIGAGVSGLTTGLHLLSRGYDVEIVTDQLPGQTTSSKAAAIWFPYEVRPIDQANRWSKESFDIFIELSQDNTTGVSLIPVTVMIEKEEDAWWLDAFPHGFTRKAEAHELSEDRPLGYIATVPLIETQVYLDYLLNEFKAQSGRVTIRKVDQISDLESNDSIVVNCAGLGSLKLVDDQDLYPIAGQIVKARKQEHAKCILAEFGFDEKGEMLAYIVPRNDCLILGGTAMRGKSDTLPDDQITAGIIERCKSIAPELDQVEIINVEVGLRPGRSEIRLERDGNVIHNYGHGGAGFTVSWGCALEVGKLIEKIV